MVTLAQWDAVVNVRGPSRLNDVNDSLAWDDPDDVAIFLHHEGTVFCPRHYHFIYEELSTGEVTKTKTYEKKKMHVSGSRRRQAIVLADLRSCKRGSAYDIFKLNGPNADIYEILTNPYVRFCKIWFNVPDYYCPYCDEENKRNPKKHLRHYHRAVPEWMIWTHQITMIVQLLIILEKTQQFLGGLDSDTASGWIREGKRLWGRVRNNSKIEKLIEERDPTKAIFQDGKKATVFWIYYIIPPWMEALV